MKKLNVVLLYGGKSGEHEISLISSSTIARNLSSAYDITLVGITKQGVWYKQNKNELKRIKEDSSAVLTIKEDDLYKISLMPAGAAGGALVCGGTSVVPCDIAFCAVHGQNGEDGSLQGMLEALDVAYTGCDVFSSSATMDKDFTKRLLDYAGVPIVPFCVLTRHDTCDCAKYDAIIQKVIKDIGFPLFVKPCKAGSSQGANKAADLRQLHFYLMEAFNWDDKVLIEKAIDAREIECAVMGNFVTDDYSDERLQVKSFAPGEIAPTHDFYDYDAKYNDPDGAALWIPAHIDAKMQKTVQDLAKKAYCTLDMSGLARVDFFIDKTNGKLYLNEINSMPGFTSISMFPKMCLASGMSFESLLDSIIAQGLQRYKCKKNICTSIK